MVIGFNSHIVSEDRKTGGAIFLSSRKWHHIVVGDGAHGRNHLDSRWKRDTVAVFNCGRRFHQSVGFE